MFSALAKFLGVWAGVCLIFKGSMRLFRAMDAFYYF